MNIFCFFVCVLTCWFSFDLAFQVTADPTSIQVETPLGTIVGQTDQFQNVPLYLFLGIPYGETTGGSNRFLPVKLRSTLPSNPYHATNRTAHCPISYVDRFGDVPIAEDCLHLNIWMPQKHFTRSAHNQLQCNSHKLPVLLYLYGGEGSIFLLDHEGQNLMYDGSAYAAFGDLIFITINYRAGAFGQLMAPETIPGNAGLFDQSRAMEWVHRYIESFCGDKRRVTIMGNSYGSMAVGLHLLSKQSRSFFNQAIMQSGSPIFNPFYPDQPEESYAKSLQFASKFNCVRNKEKRAEKKTIDLKCLQQVPLKELIDKLSWLQPFLMFGGDFFDAQTVYEYKHNNQLRIDRSKKLLIGLVTNEVCISGRSFTDLIQKYNPEPHLPYTQTKQLLSNVTNFLFSSIDKNQLKMFTPAISTFYAKQSLTTNQSIFQTIDTFASDFVFNCPTVLYAEAASARLPVGNVHAFIVDHVPKHHLSSKLDQIPDSVVGVCHADEIQFNFAQPYRYPTLFADADRLYTKMLIQTMATFVHQKQAPSVTTTGSDRFEQIAWPKSDKKNLNFVHIQVEQLLLKDSSIEHRCNTVWSKLRPVLLKQSVVAQLKEPENYLTLILIVALMLIVISWFICCCSKCRHQSQYTRV